MGTFDVLHQRGSRKSHFLSVVVLAIQCCLPVEGLNVLLRSLGLTGLLAFAAQVCIIGADADGVFGSFEQIVKQWFS
jgi:hypothetical protein